MPEISNFNGYRITMNYNDHQPPHIHVEYQGLKSVVEIKDPMKDVGQIKKKDLKMIRRWIKLHKDELLNNWEAARNHELLLLIEPYKKG